MQFEESSNIRNSAMTRLSKLIVQLSALSLESASLFNACTLVPTVFRWHGKMEFTFHFHFSFFVFAWHWKTDMNFVFRFHITLKNAFELRFSFLFSHPLLWKRDMNFFFRFHITLKTDLNFVFVWLVIWKTDLNFVCHLKSPHTPSRLTGEFTFYAKESNWIWPRDQSEWWTPPPPWYVPHTLYSIFKKGWQIIWW